MFGTSKLIMVPSTIQRPIKIGMRCTFGSLVVMFAGMIFASLWQWAMGIKATSLMESPFLLQLIMIGGFASLIISIIGTQIGIPIWNKIRHNSMSWF